MRSVAFTLMLFGYLGCKSSQNFITEGNLTEYSLISNYYNQQDSLEQAIEFYSSEGSRVKQVILIRHGEPILDKHSARSRKKMKQYVYDYDTAHVKPFQHSPVSFNESKLDTVYSSPIVRASDTAHKLFRDHFVIVEDSIFREFEREVFPLPFFRLRPKTWGVISRIPWILGLQSRNIEGFRNAKQRAKSDVQFLIAKANQNGRAVLVAHGFLNRYVSKFLQEEGWQLSHDGGKDYLSVQVLTKISD